MKLNRVTRQAFAMDLVRGGSAMYGYFVHQRRGVFSAPLARRFSAPESVEDMPEWMIQQGNVAPESVEQWRGLFERIERGETGASVMVRLRSDDGGFGQYWLRGELVCDDQGKPFFALITSDNFTEMYEQQEKETQRLEKKANLITEMYRHQAEEAQRLERKASLFTEMYRHQAEEAQRLQQTTNILRLTAQHSERVVCHYSVKNQSADVVDKDICAKCQMPHLCQMQTPEFLQSGRLPQESVEALRKMFRAIEAGEEYGEFRVQVFAEDGSRRWLDVKYSTICGDDGKPVSAILSHKDVTEAYEHELAYRRYVQSVEFDAESHLLYIESDLTADRVDKLAGYMVTEEDRGGEYTHSGLRPALLDSKFRYESQEGANRYFSRKNLLERFAAGERQLESEWRVKFTDGSYHWLDVETVLVSDPYNGHVKAFRRMLDVTEDVEEELEIKRRSERDSMTGIYNRATAEARARKLMEEQGPGVLMLIDLDDLKTINDTFGHKEGDRAILGITQTMQSHFRESDVLGRLGGDEFMVYLPNAADSVDSISFSVTSLLRTLSALSVGENDERRIHCSVGCAVQSAEAGDFDTLFKRADTALYHVKRAGKNNFAFYDPEMENEDYEFRAQKLISMRGAKKIDKAELQQLLKSITTFYQLVLSVNLSGNDYYLMEEDKEGILADAPMFGAVDTLIRDTAPMVHPDDVEVYFAALTSKPLLEAYQRGEKYVRCHFRYIHNGEYRWAEGVVIFYVDEQGDLCDFTLLRWADERAGELDRLWPRDMTETDGA